MLMKAKERGFTLIEILLVLVIIGMFIFMGTSYIQQKTLSSRIDRTSLQMQQILNAGLAYYVTNGSWPTSIACLQASSPGCTVAYLPSSLTSPWGQSYSLASPGSPPNILYVYTAIT